MPGAKNTDAPGTAPDPVNPAAAKAAGKWSNLGKVLGYAWKGLGIATGVYQAVMGGQQIDDGIKNNNPYDIASGAFNVVSGALSVGSSVAALAGASALAIPLAVASVIAGGIAGIIDFVNSLDDDEKFADEIEKMYGLLGILKEGWRSKMEEAYRDASDTYNVPNHQA